MPSAISRTPAAGWLCRAGSSSNPSSSEPVITNMKPSANLNDGAGNGSASNVATKTGVMNAAGQLTACENASASAMPTANLNMRVLAMSSVEVSATLATVFTNKSPSTGRRTGWSDACRICRKAPVENYFRCRPLPLPGRLRAVPEPQLQRRQLL